MSTTEENRSKSARMTTRVIIAICLSAILGCTYLLVNSVQAARAAVQQSQSKCHLKCIGLALHNYHDVNDTFPPAGIFDVGSEPLMSWQALILPHVDQNPRYQRIKKNEAWTSPANRQAFSENISVFTSPDRSDRESLSSYAGNSHLFPAQGVTIKQLGDGATHTMMVGEVCIGLKPWGDPTNVRDPAVGFGKTPQQFGGPWALGTNILMADGMVRFVPHNLDSKVLKAIATPNGGERVGDFW